MAKKGNRIQVILECTEHKDSGMPGTSRYITTKNKKNTPDRLELKKYNPILKKVTMAKKTVATLQGKSKRLTKVIKMVKSPKTGAYTFVEGVMAPELAEEFLKKK